MQNYPTYKVLWYKSLFHFCFRQNDHEDKEGGSPVVIKQVHSISERMYCFFTAPVVIFLYNVVRIKFTVLVRGCIVSSQPLLLFSSIMW